MQLDLCIVMYRALNIYAFKQQTVSVCIFPLYMCNSCWIRAIVQSVGHGHSVFFVNFATCL